MSIITEALKKAEFEKKLQGTGAVSVEEISSTPKPYQPSRRVSPLVGLFSLTFFAFLILAFGYQVYLRVVVPKPLLSTAPRKVVPAAAPAVFQLNTGKTSKFVLSGIIADPEKSSAIINGEIVNVGETIQTAKVLAVDEGGATLEDNGEEVRLVM